MALGGADRYVLARAGGPGAAEIPITYRRRPARGSADVVERLAGRVRLALEAADLDAYAELLDPGLRCGPPGDRCHHARTGHRSWPGTSAAGARARVTETLVSGNRILVGLRVTGRPATGAGDETDRWQGLTPCGGPGRRNRRFEDWGGAAASARLATGRPWARRGRRRGLGLAMTGSS